jgi:predicted tellurium resistance membrane protein TerC
VSRSDLVKGLLAAVLYMAGVGLALYTYYVAHAAHNSPAPGYIYLWWIGVMLVALAAMLWPKEGVLLRTEYEGRGSGGDEEGSEKKASRKGGGG